VSSSRVLDGYKSNPKLRFKKALVSELFGTKALTNFLEIALSFCKFHRRRLNSHQKPLQNELPVSKHLFEAM